MNAPLYTNADTAYTQAFEAAETRRAFENLNFTFNRAWSWIRMHRDDANVNAQECREATVREAREQLVSHCGLSADAASTVILGWICTL